MAHLPSPPQQLTGFVGRGRELEELGQLLATTRLVTLTGVGGSGKTRLAIELATKASEADGTPVAWVDLAPVADPGLLGRYVAAALGLGEQPGRTPEETLLAELAPHAWLVALDNCEHLVDASATLVRSLLLGCPRLRVLATSREALGIAGETAWLVPPLSLPPAAATAAEVRASEAGQLFLRRAREASAAFGLDDENAGAVATICRRMDGMPLAIELAAARVRMLDPGQIARRLDDLFQLLGTAGRAALPRHRTLREAIDWSHALVDDRERALFRRLGVFVGGFTLEAAEAVCAAGVAAGADGTAAGADGTAESGPPGEAEPVLEVLAALVDKSMVRPDPLPDAARFALLEPMRQYALEKLRESGEAETLRERHGAFFAALAELAEPHVRGGTRGSEWMNRLEREHGNLRAAADWADERPERAALALRLASALLWFHFCLGLFERPRQRLALALERADPASVPARERGRALVALGYLAIWQGDHAAIAPPLAAGAELLREAGDPASLAFALIGLGTAAGLAGDRGAADALFDEAQAAIGGREAARRAGYAVVFLFAFAEYWRGVVAQFHGDLAGARACFQTAVSTARQFGDHPTIAHPLAALVRVLALEGDLDGAAAALAESLPIHARNEDRWGLVQALDGAASVAAGRGGHEQAARLLGAADAIREHVGAALPPHERIERDRIAASLRGALGAEPFEACLRAGRALPLDQVVAEALGGRGAPGREETPPPGARRPDARKVPGAPDGPGIADRPGAPGSDATRPGLRVLALGPLRILRDGHELDRDAFGPAKPRELLLFLLTRPGGATRQQLGLALWPELPADRVANSFHVTVHRLRRALGGPGSIVLRDERYAVAPSLGAELDAAVFEGAAAAALAEARAGRPEADRLVDRLSAGVSLYRGPFLEDEVVGDWHLDVRDRLHRLYVDALLALGSALVEAERIPEAADAYRRAIAAEDLHEEAYRRLMTCLARTGDRTGALRLFRQLVTLLKDELDAEPEPETLALFERLQHAEPV